MKAGDYAGIIFSSAQLNTVALSVFLGGALSKSNPKVNTIFIDDPIGHFDDLNVLSFIDVLRTIITETNWQIIISTHEENFYEVMKIKLNSKYYNSKFLNLKMRGILKKIWRVDVVLDKCDILASKIKWKIVYQCV